MDQAYYQNVSGFRIKKGRVIDLIPDNSSNRRFGRDDLQNLISEIDIKSEYFLIINSHSIYIIKPHLQILQRIWGDQEFKEVAENDFNLQNRLRNLVGKPSLALQAPEQLLSISSYDKRSNCFSEGFLLEETPHTYKYKGLYIIASHESLEELYRATDLLPEDLHFDMVSNQSEQKYLIASYDTLTEFLLLPELTSDIEVVTREALYSHIRNKRNVTTTTTQVTHTPPATQTVQTVQTSSATITQIQNDPSGTSKQIPSVKSLTLDFSNTSSSTTSMNPHEVMESWKAGTLTLAYAEKFLESDLDLGIPSLRNFTEDLTKALEKLPETATSSTNFPKMNVLKYKKFVRLFEELEEAMNTRPDGENYIKPAEPSLSNWDKTNTPF